TMPGWHDVPLRVLLEDALGLRVFVENDANLGALAEHYWGAARALQRGLHLSGRRRHWLRVDPRRAAVPRRNRLGRRDWAPVGGRRGAGLPVWRLWMPRGGRGDAGAAQPLQGDRPAGAASRRSDRPGASWPEPSGRADRDSRRVSGRGGRKYFEHD